jgi:cytochrome c nitrite reductase small subunit
MSGLFRKIAPPGRWRLPVIVVSGILTGLLLFVAHISRVASYLSDDPSTCMNCHVMAPQYATWNHSSHREKTNCNDCHVPHNNVLNKYYFKAKDGMRHATMFTLRMEPQVIFIKEEGRAVVQENCIRCHSDLLSDEKVNKLTMVYQHQRTERPCWECHRETPHGRVNSLSSVPYARVPLSGSTLPNWLISKRNNQKKQ